MVAFGEARCRSGGLSAEPCRGHQVTVTLVQVRRDSGVSGQGGVEFRQGGGASPRAVGLAERDGTVEAGYRAGR